VATKKVPEEVAKALADARKKMPSQKPPAQVTQKELAVKANVDVKWVANLERAGADFPDMPVVLKLQKAANVRLTGSNIGQPLFGGPKK
jgi:putative transcription factor